ncbi:MAG: molecular chaperone TorD family protein [Caldimonas sp.]
MSPTSPGPATASVNFGVADDRDEIARAELYGLLAALFYAPMTDELHVGFRTAVTVAPVEGAFLERSWSDLVAVARRIGLAEARDEYAGLFLGIGKPEVFLYGSYYLAGTLNQQPLVALRHDLRGLGLERSQEVGETEDHIAALCEVMRYLIAGDDVGTSHLAAQRRFFDAHLRGWVESLCATIAGHPAADLYAAAARFAGDFFAVEMQGFDLLDA